MRDDAFVASASRLAEDVTVVAPMILHIVIILRGVEIKHPNRYQCNKSNKSRISGCLDSCSVTLVT
jgi:hypothetical protein